MRLKSYLTLRSEKKVKDLLHIICVCIRVCMSGVGEWLVGGCVLGVTSQTIFTGYFGSPKKQTKAKNLLLSKIHSKVKEKKKTVKN